MLEAIHAAERVGAELVLADRDIQATLKRTWAALRLWDRMQLLATLVASVFAKHEISEEQVEALKDKDTIGELIREFAELMPRLQRPLIDERDRYLISVVREAPGRRVVAVVGAGHVGGMVGYLDEPVDREALSRIPSPTLLSQLVKWIIPVIVLGAFYKGYSTHRGEGLEEMLFAWVLPNSVLAAVFSVVAGAKLLTVLSAFVASPITSLNPTIGAGMVAALVEAWLRKPNVADCEELGEVSTLRDWYANRFTRVLLVGLGATVGSALGAYVGAAWVVKLL
jgi:pheromone shutdown-related protein TraB